MTAIERYEPPRNEIVTDDRYMDRIPAMAEQFARSNLCPEAFRGKPNDVAIIGYSLADLGLRMTINTLPHCYVVHGRIGVDSQLQAGLAARCGYTTRPKPNVCNESTATVQIVDRDGHLHEVTFTMVDAERAGLTKPSKTGEPSMYKKYPREMLIARATTRAIKWHAPEVMLGLAGTANAFESDVVDVDQGSDGVEVGVSLISSAAAKTQLLAAFKNEGFNDDRAKELAAELWHSNGLGSEPISPETLEALLADASGEPAEGEVVDEAPDPEPEVDDPDSAPFE